MKLKTLTLYSMFAAMVVSPAFSDENMKKIPNTVFVKIEVGEFFGLFDKNNAEIKIVMPAKNAYGFEGKANTEMQQGHQDRVNNYLMENIIDIVKIDDATCSYTPDKDQNQNSDIGGDDVNYVKAFYNVKCDHKLSKNKVHLNFSKFKNLEQIKVKLEGFKERVIILKGNQGTIVLK